MSFTAVQKVPEKYDELWVAVLTGAGDDQAQVGFEVSLAGQVAFLDGFILINSLRSFDDLGIADFVDKFPDHHVCDVGATDLAALVEKIQPILAAGDGGEHTHQRLVVALALAALSSSAS